MRSQGERGPAGPPGIQGETGTGLPGAKVNGVMDYPLNILNSIIVHFFGYFAKHSYYINLQGDKGHQGQPGLPGPPGVGEHGPPVS